MNGDILLTFNPGSSTIKLGLFAIEVNRPRRETWSDLAAMETMR
jgi:hypothetical protein